jgi:phage tail sheath protein FI
MTPMAPPEADQVNRPERGDPAILAAECLRELEARGDMAPGAPPAAGNAPAAPRWNYISVRRVTLFLESSLAKGLQWAVFEPNGPALWAQVRVNVGAFMQTLFLQGVFQGTTPAQAYFVRCGPDTMTQADIDGGRLNMLVGFAPVLPAEFVVFQISQMVESPQS